MAQTHQLVVGTSSIAVLNAADRVRKGIEIKADNDNSEQVYVGVKGATTITEGFRLNAGESIFIPCNDLGTSVTDPDNIEIIGSAAAQRTHIFSV